ncbi:hypothetical protein, partial [Bacteroides acidifaciens]
IDYHDTNICKVITITKGKTTFFHFHREPCQWLHSSGVLVHPLAVQRSPTDDFLLCLVSFSLLSGFCSQAHPEHMAERLQIPSGRLTFAKGYSTL